MSKSKLIALHALILILASCVSTKVSSLKDPLYGTRHFNKVIVFGKFGMIEDQKSMEDELVADLKDKGVAAIASYQLLPPLREYSDSEKLAVFHDNALDCYLIVSKVGTNTDEIHVPTYTTANVAVTSNTGSAHGSGTAATSGGYKEERVSSFDFKAELHDLANGKLVCRCEANTELQYNAYGQTWARKSDVTSSACSHFADELLKNDLFKELRE